MLTISLSAMGKSTKPPLPLWAVSIVGSAMGLTSGLLLGGSLLGYFLGLLGTVCAFGSLYIDRQRQMSRDYDYSYPWFRGATSAAYVVGVLATIVHIVRYAIELGNA